MFHRLIEDSFNVFVAERVENSFSLTAGADQTSFFKDFELMGDSGLGHIQLLGNIADTEFASAENEYYSYSCGIAEYFQKLRRLKNVPPSVIPPYKKLTAANTAAETIKMLTMKPTVQVMTANLSKT